MKDWTVVIILITLCACSSLMVQAEVRHVPETYPNIQVAVDAALDGDTVLLAAGTYTGEGNRDISIVDKCLTIMSEGPADLCVLDAEAESWDPHRVFLINGKAQAQINLRNITVQGGYASPYPDEDAGGFKIQKAHVTLDSCIIRSNFTNTSSGQGGGIYCNESNLDINNCLFYGNYARSGGGLSCNNSTVNINRTQFVSNTVESGGGGAIDSVLDSQLTVTDCVFTNNMADGMMSDGGAIFSAGSFLTVIRTEMTGNTARLGGGIRSRSTTKIDDCNFSNNTARFAGGGVSTYQNDVTITNSIFQNNDTESDISLGGGLYIDVSNFEISNCLITGNSADTGGGIAIHCYEDPDEPLLMYITNCTIADNSDEGIYSRIPDTAHINNCIFWNNLRKDIDGSEDALFDVQYSFVEDGFTGTGNITGDPLFTTGAGCDYFLSQTATGQPATSPCVDSGSSIASEVCIDASTDQFCMDQVSTRQDFSFDTGQVDMGYHAIQPAHGLELKLNAEIFTPGSAFYLECMMHNAGSETLNTDIYILLEVYGGYWCYPGWTNLQDQLDFRANISVDPGYYRYQEAVLQFTWPEGVGTAMGLNFLGAAFDAGTYNLIGDLCVIDWGFVE